MKEKKRAIDKIKAAKAQARKAIGAQSSDQENEVDPSSSPASDANAGPSAIQMDSQYDASNEGRSNNRG